MHRCAYGQLSGKPKRGAGYDIHHATEKPLKELLFLDAENAAPFFSEGEAFPELFAIVLEIGTLHGPNGGEQIVYEA